MAAKKTYYALIDGVLLREHGYIELKEKLLKHVKDPRPSVALKEIKAGLYMYLGPRVQRRNIVAYVGTADALLEAGLALPALSQKPL